MADYGQFCPVAKATEIVGERWTLLIVRELMLGTCRFNDFQRAF
jgi:DNA-binding HxlR family transcriptional regulator